ncbi:MAG: hypothetical protein FWD50_05385 [Betaproteobacteria bacterium]|nr:hypothetical protein [Betaproteobacteria bacterium]
MYRQILHSTTNIIGLIVVAVALVACSDSTVSIVKDGKLSICQTATVNQMAKGFMEKPSFDSRVSDTGAKLVNLSGNVTLNSKPVKAVVQFVVNKENGTFEYRAFEIDGVPQNTYMANGLFMKMCANAKN